MKAKVALMLAGIAIAAVALSGPAEAQMQKVKVATEGAYAPFNFKDTSGQLQGFDVDIAKALCAKAKFDCEIVAQDWDGIIPGLLAKKYDAIISSMAITAERQKKVLFTDKYANTPSRFVAKKGSNIEITPAGLKGKRVGVQRATVHENFVRAKFPEADVVVYDTTDNANADLAAGRLDLRLDDSVALDLGFLKTDAGKDFVFVGPGFYEPREILGNGSGIALRKQDTALGDAFNKALKEIRANGTYKKINDKYFSFDVYGPETGS